MFTFEGWLLLSKRITYCVNNNKTYTSTWKPITRRLNLPGLGFGPASLCFVSALGTSSLFPHPVYFVTCSLTGGVRPLIRSEWSDLTNWNMAMRSQRPIRRAEEQLLPPWSHAEALWRTDGRTDGRPPSCHTVSHNGCHGHRGWKHLCDYEHPLQGLRAVCYISSVRAFHAVFHDPFGGFRDVGLMQFPALGILQA